MIPKWGVWGVGISLRRLHSLRPKLWYELDSKSGVVDDTRFSKACVRCTIAERMRTNGDDLQLDYMPSGGYWHPFGCFRECQHFAQDIHSAVGAWKKVSTSVGFVAQALTHLTI